MKHDPWKHNGLRASLKSWGQIESFLFYLEDGEKSRHNRIEIGGGGSLRKVEGPTKKLHSEKSKDEDEQEQKEQERENRGNGIHQCNHQVPQTGPIPGT